MSFEAWFVVVMVSLAAGFGLLGLWREKKRTEAWRRVAEELGLAYFGRENDVWSRFQQLQSLQVGRSQVFRNGVQGDTGDTEIVVADFRYVTGHGKHRRAHTRTVCILRSQCLALPHCQLRPQNFLGDLMGKVFGMQDIDFAEDPEFSRAYNLQGDNETAVRMLFDVHRRPWFTDRRGRGLHFEGAGDILLFHAGRQLSPEKTRELMQDALELRGILTAAPL